MGDKNSDGDIPMNEIEEDILHADDAPVPVNMYTFGNLVRLLSGKKRGEYPTTMQTAGKDAAIIGDLKILSDQGGPSFNNRLVVLTLIVFLLFYLINIIIQGNILPGRRKWKMWLVVLGYIFSRKRILVPFLFLLPNLSQAISKNSSPSLPRL